jgi:hypothetical protein
MSPSKRSNSGRSKRSGNRKRGKGGANKTKNFWGEQGSLPDVERPIRIAADPSAVVRSLGRPPLQGHETIAAHYFEAVYDRSVVLAGALAAAGDLIEPDELTAD